MNKIFDYESTYEDNFASFISIGNSNFSLSIRSVLKKKN